MWWGGLDLIVKSWLMSIIVIIIIIIINFFRVN